MQTGQHKCGERKIKMANGHFYSFWKKWQTFKSDSEKGSIDACSKAGFRIITGVKFKLGMCAGEGTEHLSHCCCWSHSEREPGLAESELPCLARSWQSFVCNKPWSALWALHLSGYQGQAGQCTDTPHSNISTAHRGAGAAFVFDMLELQTSSSNFHKTYTDASISSEVTWHQTSLHKGVRSRQPVFRTGRQEWAVQGAVPVGSAAPALLSACESPSCSAANTAQALLLLRHWAFLAWLHRSNNTCACSVPCSLRMCQAWFW